MYCRFMYAINVISRRQRNGYNLGEGWFSNCEIGTPFLSVFVSGLSSCARRRYQSSVFILQTLLILWTLSIVLGKENHINSPQRYIFSLRQWTMHRIIGHVYNSRQNFLKLNRVVFEDVVSLVDRWVSLNMTGVSNIICHVRVKVYIGSTAKKIKFSH